MQFAPSVGPCGGRCGKNIRYSRKRGALGLCASCLADPVKKQEAIDLRVMMEASMAEWLEENTIPDPLGRPGIRKAKPGAFR